MNTTDIMQLALSKAGMDSIPVDSAIFHPAKDVRRILLGIDIGEADLLRAKDEGFDLVIAHHPPDQTRFIAVMDRHEELLLRAEVPKEKALTACKHNKAPYENWASKLPPDTTPDHLTSLAQRLGLGFMNVHQPCDELGRRMMQDLADSVGSLGTVQTLMNVFQTIPEIHQSSEGVQLVCGNPKAITGKTIVIHAAGTNGGYPVANTLFEHGITTVVYIYLSSKQATRLHEEQKGNLILTGHYASDSLGINPLIDALEANDIEIVCCNKMIRVRR